jgi:putative hydrolase
VSSDPGDLFRGIFGDMLKMLRTDSPVQWELATQLARSVAAGDATSEGNVDPSERMRFAELSRIAELYVADVTGMATSAKGPLTVTPANRVDWALRSLEAWKPFIEKLASSIAPEKLPAPPPGDEPDGEAGFAAMIEQWAVVIAPAMLAMQVGSIVGHLARRCFGQYELPLPRATLDEVLVVPPNVAEFATDWSLPPDDVRMWVCLSAAGYHAVLSRPHVRDRLESLLLQHAHGFRPDPRALEAKLEGLDITDFSALTSMLGDPAALGESVDTPELRRVRSQLSALTAMIAGYVEHVATTAGARLIGSQAALREAMRRRRVERGDGERGAETLFGLRLDQEIVDQGFAFVTGVLERGGESELAKLWVVEANLPTPAEVGAPGLWIERVNLPIDSPSPAPSVSPDA